MTTTPALSLATTTSEVFFFHFYSYWKGGVTVRLCVFTPFRREYVDCVIARVFFFLFFLGTLSSPTTFLHPTTNNDDVNENDDHDSHRSRSKRGSCVRVTLRRASGLRTSRCAPPHPSTFLSLIFFLLSFPPPRPSTFLSPFFSRSSSEGANTVGKEGRQREGEATTFRAGGGTGVSVVRGNALGMTGFDQSLGFGGGAITVGNPLLRSRARGGGGGANLVMKEMERAAARRLGVHLHRKACRSVTLEWRRRRHRGRASKERKRQSVGCV